METLEIAVFNDAFGISSRHSSLRLNDEGVLMMPKTSNRAARQYRFIKNGAVLVPTKYSEAFVFHESFDDVDVSLVEIHDVVKTYHSDVEGLKEIDEATYEKLSDNFKKKYYGVSSGEQEVSIDFELKTENYNVDFDLKTYEGEKETELQKIVYSPDRKRSPGFTNFDPTPLSPTLILGILVFLHKQDGNNKQVTLDASKTFSYSYHKEHMDKYDYIKVGYFVKPYEGETKKKLSTKSNGQPYADRRGYTVPDYPKVASEVIVFAEDIAEFHLDQGTDEQNLEAIKALYQSIFYP